MGSLTSLQRIVLGIGIIAFVMVGLFAPWDALMHKMWITETAITEWPTRPAGRHLIFFPPEHSDDRLLWAEEGGLRLAVDRLVVEWLIVVGLTVGSVLILKQNQTSRT